MSRTNCPGWPQVPDQREWGAKSKGSPARSRCGAPLQHTAAGCEPALARIHTPPRVRVGRQPARPYFVSVAAWPGQPSAVTVIRTVVPARSAPPAPPCVKRPAPAARPRCATFTLPWLAGSPAPRGELSLYSTRRRLNAAIGLHESPQYGSQSVRSIHSSASAAAQTR